MATRAVTEFPIKAAGLIHPSNVTVELARGVNSPMYLMPALNDPDMVNGFAHVLGNIVPRIIYNLRFCLILYVISFLCMKCYAKDSEIKQAIEDLPICVMVMRQRRRIGPIP